MTILGKRHMAVAELSNFGFLIAGFAGVFDDFGDSKQADQHGNKVQAAHQVRLTKNEAVGTVHKVQADGCQQQAHTRRDQAFH